MGKAQQFQQNSPLRNLTNICDNSSSLPLNMNTPRSFETSAATYAMTRRHIPEDLNPNEHAFMLSHVASCLETDGRTGILISSLQACEHA
jgi:hypothetical protein